MKMVAFTRPMSPYGKGETRVLPDDVADGLIAAGDAESRPSVFDAQPADQRPPKRQRYLTRSV